MTDGVPEHANIFMTPCIMQARVQVFACGNACISQYAIIIRSIERTRTIFE